MWCLVLCAGLSVVVEHGANVRLEAPDPGDEALNASVQLGKGNRTRREQLHSRLEAPDPGDEALNASVQLGKGNRTRREQLHSLLEARQGTVVQRSAELSEMLGEKGGLNCGGGRTKDGACKRSAGSASDWSCDDCDADERCDRQRKKCRRCPNSAPWARSPDYGTCVECNSDSHCDLGFAKGRCTSHKCTYTESKCRTDPRVHDTRRATATSSSHSATTPCDCCCRKYTYDTGGSWFFKPGTCVEKHGGKVYETSRSCTCTPY